MLRGAVLWVAVALIALGLWLIWSGVRRPGFEALGAGTLVLLSIWFERWRYRPPGRSAPPGEGSDPEWRPTGEHFEDPGSGEQLNVQYNARTGERRYVRTGESPAPPGARRD